MLIEYWLFDECEQRISVLSIDNHNVQTKNITDKNITAVLYVNAVY